MENPHALSNNPGQRWDVAILRLALTLGLLTVALSASAADASTNEPAVVKISGFGFLENRELVRLLRSFQVEDRIPTVIDRMFVEDATLVLLARATEEGYLRASLAADCQLTSGWRQQFVWTNVLEVALPRDFAASDVHFELNPGVRFYYDTLEFNGLEAISEREAWNYFVSAEALLKLRRNRVFSPAALRSSLAALREAYARAGYQHALVTTNELILNEETGAVHVGVVVSEGLPTVVRSVEVAVFETNPDQPVSRQTLHPQRPYSQLWQQQFAEELRTEQFRRGFPDTVVEFFEKTRATNASTIEIDLAARVETGSFIRVGRVVLEGNERTKTSVLDRRISLSEGDPLDRVKAEESRQRLARLGAFDSVRLNFEEVDSATRDVKFEFTEGKPLSLSLLAGFGSYELLRGGLEFEHRNVLGLGHAVRLRAIQSFKSSNGDLLYTVPDVFGQNLNLFLQGDGLRREEVSFTREEYGGSMGVQKMLAPIQTDVSLRYDYQFLNALDFDAPSTSLPGVTNARSAAIVLEMNRDRRDHPLLPGRGLKLYGRVEFASEALGGNVDYQRLILGASYHLDLHGGRFLHLGVRHGMSFTLGGDSEDLPFSKRFFPGGENSVRGYQEGEACPVDANGDQLGAETFTEASVELEQLLTKSWSVVAFFDAVGFAEDRSNYPWDEGLYSVGAGLRWRTLIGPVRLEYGYNLNRRTHDPAGTLHFSIGVPF